jgi:hypothetical protein
MNALLRVSLLAVVALLPLSCGRGYTTVDVTVPASEVSLLVVATDAGGYAIEGVEVEVLSVWHEWSGRRWSPDPFYSLLTTNRFGEAYFSPERLASMDVGFLLDTWGAAVLSSSLFEDEASIEVRIGAPSLGYITVDVDIDELHSAGYIEVQF